MSREMALAILALVVCGPATLICGLLPLGRPGSQEGWRLEAASWRRVWQPLIPGCLLLGVLGGWALREPGRTDELLLPSLLVSAIPFGAIWIRACGRAARVLFHRVDSPAATIGLIRPRVVIDPRFLEVLDGRGAAAARAHEAAHVRHRDPLRIWLAQLATDLQWPSPRAGARLCAWMDDLELARDEEARLRGIAGEDLAAAVLAAARMSREHAVVCHPGLASAALSLRRRIRRLLEPLPARARPPRRRPLGLLPLMAAGILLALAAGVVRGDAVVQALPGVLP